MCERWLVFDNFLVDMGAGYKSGLSIERKNVNGNYEPGNVVWLPVRLQPRNKRNTRFSIEIARDMRRLRKEGWSYYKIAEHYNTQASSVHLIVAGKRWKEPEDML